MFLILYSLNLRLIDTEQGHFKLASARHLSLSHLWCRLWSLCLGEFMSCVVIVDRWMSGHVASNRNHWNEMKQAPVEPDSTLIVFAQSIKICLPTVCHKRQQWPWQNLALNPVPLSEPHWSHCDIAPSQGCRVCNIPHNWSHNTLTVDGLLLIVYHQWKKIQEKLFRKRTKKAHKVWEHGKVSLQMMNATCKVVSMSCFLRTLDL